MAISDAAQSALTGRVDGGGRHLGGTVAMHYELMRDSTLEFLCEIKITEGARRAIAGILELKKNQSDILLFKLQLSSAKLRSEHFSVCLFVPGSKCLLICSWKSFLPSCYWCSCLCHHRLLRDFLKA